MGKLTDPKWWTGQTDDQKARRAKATADLRGIKAEMGERTDQLREDIAGVRADAAEEKADRDAAYAEKRAEQREEWAEKKQAILDDREGRSLGGWGRRRKDA